MVSANNQVLQIIQGPQLIQQRPILTTAGPSPNHQQSQQQQQFIASSTTTTTTLKHNKVPQQILPKPVSGGNVPTATAAMAQNIIQQTTTTKTVVTQAKVPTVPVQPQQLHHHPHHASHSMAQFLPSNNTSQMVNPSTQSTAQHVSAATAAATQGGSILLPTGQPLNAQPLLLNQMPMIVQQNTSQGVQLILRPQTPQLAAPSLVIHNTRPQLQQPQPQQLLRILNTNGAMQLAATAPTFIVSSQANLIQQNLQSMKTNNGSPTIVGGLQATTAAAAGRQPQQLAATINSQLLGQSMAQLQNLQLNGNLTQIQMPNGLNGQFISQLPSQFQQSIAGFNQSINLNQLTNQNLSQIANAAAVAAAANQSFQSPPPQELIPTVVQAQNIQFNHAQSSSGNVTPITCTTPQPHIISSPTPQLISNNPSESPTQGIVLGTVPPQMHIVQPHTQPASQSVNSIVYQPPPKMMSSLHSSMDEKEDSISSHKLVKKPKKTRMKKGNGAPPIVPVAPTVVVSPPQSPPQQPTGKLDLANVMKLCGIMEDDYLDNEMDEHVTTPIQVQQHQQQPTETMTDTPAQIIGQLAASGQNYMITIPSSDQNSNIPITFSIPTSLTDAGHNFNQLHGMGNDGKDQPFMITIDPSVTGEAQPYTIALPKPPVHMSVMESKENGVNAVHTPSSTSTATTTKQHATVAPTVITSVPPVISSSPSTMCVPTFVNSVLNTTVTPTLQSQINEIQNQLMAAATPTTTTTTVSQPMFSPKSKRRSVGRKASKKEDKCEEIPAASVAPTVHSSISNNNSTISSVPTSIPSVPTQIGNIHISQVDGASVKNNHINTKSINNQIQIMPILASVSSTDNTQSKSGLQLPSLQSSSSNLITTIASSTSMATSTVTEVKPIATVVSTPLINSTPSQMIQTVPNVVSNVIQNGGTASMPQFIQPMSQPITTSGLLSTAIPTNLIATQNSGVQSILSQLTGHLSLSLAEDRRLLLKHDINQPQDAQSQMILQTILTGALGNVTLVNEPSKPVSVSSSPINQGVTNTHKNSVAAPGPGQGQISLQGQVITSSSHVGGNLMPQQHVFPMNFQQVRHIFDLL